MLQKTQWTMAATALAIGAGLAIAARPAQAQYRHHLTRGGTTNYTTGIVVPPSSAATTPATGIVIPTPTATTPPSGPPAPTPVVTPPAPVVTPPPPITLPQNSFFGPSVPLPSPQASSQGFSVGPTLLGDQRLPLGRLVDRVPPAIIGDSGPTVQKVVAHH